MNIRPLSDRVLILPAPAEEKTIGGIIIPDTAKEKPLQGEVVAVGNGNKDEEMILKVGDKVLYGKYSGTELEYEGVKYLIMRQSDVLAILGEHSKLQQQKSRKEQNNGKRLEIQYRRPRTVETGC